MNNNVELQIVSFINRLLHLHLDLFFRSQGLFYCGGMFITLAVICSLYFLNTKEIISRYYFYRYSYAALIIFYFSFLWKDAYNMPVTDDYHVLFFLQQYIQATSFSQKWQLLGERINECRLPLPRLYFLVIYKLFGALNFKWLILINGCLLLLFCRLLFSLFQHPQKDLLQLAFLFLLLQFQSADASFWASSGICHYGVSLLALLSIKSLLSASKYAFITSSFFALLAVFTFGNGFFLFPVCCLLLLYKKQVGKAIIFALLMAPIYIIYFYTWTNYSPRRYYDPVAALIYPFGFLGSSMQFFYTLHLPVLAGLCCVAVFCYSTYKKYYQKNTVVWAFLLFLITTAILTTPFRLQLTPLQSRYGLYSTTAIVLSIMIVAGMMEKQSSRVMSRFLHLVLASAISYNLLSGIMFYPEAPVRTQKLRTFIYDWENGLPLTYYPISIPKDADKRLANAKKAGIWTDE